MNLTPDFQEVLPELILLVGGLLLVVFDLLIGERQKHLVWQAALGVVALAAITVFASGQLLQGGSDLFFGAYVVDRFGAGFKLLALAATGAVIALSTTYFERRPALRGEIFYLLVFCGLGLVILGSSNDLILIYLAIELVSLCSYVMAGYLTMDRKSNEASLKYFLYGASASAVMVYGLSLLYGTAGSTRLAAVAQAASPMAYPTSLEITALVLIFAGFGYKLSAAPFHAWAPDVYEGAPTPVTAFLSVGPKLAALAAFVRFLQVGVPTWGDQWVPLVAVLSVLTMFVGNLGALLQTNIKRMLAYSSIAHAGYLLIGVACLGVAGADAEGSWGLSSLIVYAVVYLCMNLGAFAVAIVVGEAVGSDEIDNFAGLSKRAPLLAAAMLIFLLSLAGIPPLAGFAGKLYIFGAAIQSGNLWWLALLGIVNSVIALYYYMNVARAMYLTPPEGDFAPTRDVPVRVVIGATALLTLVLGLMPILYQFAQRAADIFAGTGTL